ncbi:MAG: hypothetical protein AVDCRST_MAG87-501 [uncultured Thermomicrobiales bacterium]|uniref:Uncharacterized protein n=1 Tax=uncultured Thermomicrobiales bacterium TaxID=1645740 RepID=A0A6J4UF13_9BACT|nr:MAG: hypothetical protein AVDCRST_MAG87-501 [uncultured Thermomicrobiales bacterium]
MVQATRIHLTVRVPAISGGRCLETIHEILADVDGAANIHASVESKLLDVDIDPTRIATDEVEALLAKGGLPPMS